MKQTLFKFGGSAYLMHVEGDFIGIMMKRDAKGLLHTAAELDEAELMVALEEFRKVMGREH